MANGLTDTTERRKTPRVGPAHTIWGALALLRPGQDVFVINVSVGGALLESQARMSPGARAELQLLGPMRRIIAGRIARCHVSALEPLRYRGAIVFEEPLELGAAAP